MTLRIHIFQHVPFEGPALIAQWAERNNCSISFTRFFADDTLPNPNSFDMLIVLGGPMGVKDVQQYPWLQNEICFLQKVLENNTPILGICLGSQLIANALGSSVYPGNQKEIGWYPLSIHQYNFPAGLQKHIPTEPVVFHWHGDTFDLPDNSKVLASTAVTPHQGFIYNDRVIGLQFHLETNVKAMENLLEYAADEIVDSRYIQNPELMLATQQYIEPNRKFLFAILDHLSELC